jgi:hypothetical protein
VALVLLLPLWVRTVVILVTAFCSRAAVAEAAVHQVLALATQVGSTQAAAAAVKELLMLADLVELAVLAALLFRRPYRN